MPLELNGIIKDGASGIDIHETNISFADGSFNVLLGATRAGKTTLMQLMAGIQKPTSGKIIHEGKDVTHVAVQKRNVSMVYQQFINYPMMTVFENIASPLRVARMSEPEIASRVCKAAELLRLGPMLKRKPAELSGGQQQRTAIARAIVKDSALIFMDEPLANLDYKLREELRDELPKLFAGRKSIVFYATTEPHEALLFGGHTALLHEGKITQYGPTAQVYRNPNSRHSAEVFSNPPLNVFRVTKLGKKLELPGGLIWPVNSEAAKLSDGTYDIGLKPHYLSPTSAKPGPHEILGRVLITEISGSESVVHVTAGGQSFVSQTSGVQPIKVGETVRLSATMEHAMFFAVDGKRVL